MSILGKAAAIAVSVLGAATGAVAVENAIKARSDEEVGHTQGVYEKYVKRPLDFACAGIATIALSPIIGGTALVVRLKLGKPVFFMQERPGLDEKSFYLIFPYGKKSPLRLPVSPLHRTISTLSKRERDVY